MSKKCFQKSLIFIVIFTMPYINLASKAMDESAARTALASHQKRLKNFLTDEPGGYMQGVRDDIPYDELIRLPTFNNKTHKRIYEEGLEFINGFEWMYRNTSYEGRPITKAYEGGNCEACFAAWSYIAKCEKEREDAEREARYAAQRAVAQQQAALAQAAQETKEKADREAKEAQDRKEAEEKQKNLSASNSPPSIQGGFVQSGNNLLSTIKSLKSTIAQHEKDLKELNEEKQEVEAYKLKTNQALDSLTKEKDELLSLNVSLQTKQLEKEKEIENLNEEKQIFKKFEDKITKENDNLKKEKDDLFSNVGSLKTTLVEKEEEIAGLKEERTKLYALTVDGDKTTEIIKEMMQVIGISTDDLNDCTGNIFAEKCLDRFKKEMQVL